MIVVAHSSGTYVADELLRFVRDGYAGVPPETTAKIALFNLDGGGVSSGALLRSLRSAHFVYACDPLIERCSHNAGAMQALGEEHADLGGALAVDARGSGCSRQHSGGLWCLHDTVVTTRPHNPTSYDLRRDYTMFTDGRAVVTSYLDVLAP